MIYTEMLHHSQSAFYEQAFRPVPQREIFSRNGPESLLLTMVQDVSLCRSRAGKRERQRSLE
ncbi:hypothetical protein [Microcoleus sp. F4-D5]|uniref:hypothetical protein n=1 Tax=Microcoleus sp. F4-D5 TaxID=2818760 RepID=UPI002FD21DBA